MKIALHFLSPLGGGYSVEWAEVSEVKELQKILRSQKVVTWGRYSRCIATDDGQCESESLPVDSLSQEDLEWASQDGFPRTRYISCVRPIGAS